MNSKGMTATEPRARAGDRVLRQFYGLLRDGKLKPGDRLLSERELADRFAVSRPVVREALQQLESLELIRIVPGQGTFISGDARPRFLTKYFGLLFALRQIELADVMVVRVALEAEAARAAATRAAESDLVNMDQAVDRLSMALDDHEFRGYFDAERDFHDAIFSASGNRFLAILYAALRGLFQRSFAQPHELLRRREHAAEHVACHRAIAVAIRERSPHGAVRAMHDHFAFAERLFGSELAEREVDAGLLDPS